MEVARLKTHARNLVKIAIEPFGLEHEHAASAFNRRMRNARAPGAFLLPEQARPPIRSGSASVTHYVAVDESHEVRGGVICQEHPAVIGGSKERVINIQAPLSEGIIDPAYTFVGPLLIKHVLRQTPHAFIVGMGHVANPLPRLLKAMGWTIRVVPFFFRMLRASSCLRHLSPFRVSRIKRLMAETAAMTGVAALGARLIHRPSNESEQSASQFQIEPIHRWCGWADAAWDTFAPALSFGVQRTHEVLPFFYPLDSRSPGVWGLKRDGIIEGWFGMVITPMSNNEYFGSLVVATLTDCLGTPNAVRAGMVLAIQEARAQGADLLITNQQHRFMQESCAAAGWREGPSNFLMATSPKLSETFEPETAYVTRRDGDGLVNLVP